MASPMKTNVLLGIDPGQNGAICALNLDKINHQILDIQLHKMPVNGNEIDFHSLAEIFRSYEEDNIFAYLEKVSAMPKQGVSSMFKFGRNVGAVQALLAAFKISYSEVTPQAWQKVMHMGINKTGLVHPKQRSLSAVKKLFPKVNLLPSERSRVPHDGFVDALLIAEYGRLRRMNFGVNLEKGDGLGGGRSKGT